MKRKINFFVVTALVVFFAMAADVFIIWQLNNYETRFLELYGAEQDGYVKVVLGEINRLGDDATEENITEIISSLDATASRYWTVSKEDSILFVKSVTETNRYKGFTDGTYYASDSAAAFMNRLKLNQVGHQIIYLNEDRFIASGMIFEWRGQQYRICLLTYDKALLEDNILLECKNSIIIILLLVLALLIILSMMMSKKIRGQASRIALQEERAIWQNQQLEQLDEQMKREHAFSARKRVFKHTVLYEFLQELDERGAKPIHFAVFETETQESRDEFFEHMQMVLDNRVLRFSMDDRLVLLIFARYEQAVSSKIIRSLENKKVRKVADLYCEDNTESYKRQFEQFWKAVAEE